MRTMNSQDIKKDFPVFSAYPGLVYLDSAATTQKPARVLSAAEHYYREENANPLRGLYDLSVKATDAYENARETVRQFIG
ncbi:MAG: aminotransferase class V-fold PLP-dependent enzyme, partial [Ruminococcus sp.]|nr:aminotransferase class V-fold PLP-dependent enzyme [Ruminococcus sp.]